MLDEWDVKSAFLKVDAYMEGAGELFLENVRGNEPKLPFGHKTWRRFVMMLRLWYLKLNKVVRGSLTLGGHCDLPRGRLVARRKCSSPGQHDWPLELDLVLVS